MRKLKIPVIILSLLLLIPSVFISAGAESLSIEQLRQKFPHGKYWNHIGSTNNVDMVTSTPCDHEVLCFSLGLVCYCNIFNINGCRGVQCQGFAMKLAYDFYEKEDYCSRPRVTNLDNLKSGDIIRFWNNGHAIFVLEVNGNDVRYVECNGEEGHCKIVWDKHLTKQQIAKTLTYVAVAPFALDDLPKYKIEFSANGGSYAPKAQTKIFGKNLTLTDSEPTRVGYDFAGWSRDPAAVEPEYGIASSFELNSDTVLYAVWKSESDNGNKEIKFFTTSTLTEESDLNIIFSMNEKLTVADLSEFFSGITVKASQKSTGNSLTPAAILTTGIKLNFNDSSRNYTYVLLGDLDSNGQLTAVDARIALRASALLENLDTYNYFALDVDRDSNYTAKDARAILCASGGIIKTSSWLPDFSDYTAKTLLVSSLG